MNYNLNRDRVECEVRWNNVNVLRILSIPCVCVCVSRIILHIEFQRNSLTILSRNIHRECLTLYGEVYLYFSFFCKTIFVVLYTCTFFLHSSLFNWHNKSFVWNLYPFDRKNYSPRSLFCDKFTDSSEYIKYILDSLETIILS